MRKRSIITAIVVLTAVVMFVSQVAMAAGPQTDGWPLAKGATWIYQGTVTWFDSDAQEEVTDTVTWKVEVTDAVQRDHVTGYAVKGSLEDLAAYQPGAAPADHVIVQVGVDKYYDSNDDALARLQAVDNADDPLVGLVMPELQILDLPLYENKVFGDPQQITRTDHLYAWWVTAAKPADLAGIKGAPSGMAATQYTLALVTTGDTTTLEFVPGLGIVAYDYVHNGTPAAASMRLIEYQPGQ